LARPDWRVPRCHRHVWPSTLPTGAGRTDGQPLRLPHYDAQWMCPRKSGLQWTCSNRSELAPRMGARGGAHGWPATRIELIECLQASGDVRPPGAGATDWPQWPPPLMTSPPAGFHVMSRGNHERRPTSESQPVQSRMRRRHAHLLCSCVYVGRYAFSMLSSHNGSGSRVGRVARRSIISLCSQSIFIGSGPAEHFVFTWIWPAFLRRSVRLIVPIL
jgi:hypothetical protein